MPIHPYSYIHTHTSILIHPYSYIHIQNHTSKVIHPYSYIQTPTSYIKIQHIPYPTIQAPNISNPCAPAQSYSTPLITLDALRSCLPSTTAARPTAIGADVDRRGECLGRRRGTGTSVMGNAVTGPGLGPKGPSYISFSLDPKPPRPSGATKRRT